jgi:hypothetical protein
VSSKFFLLEKNTTSLLPLAVVLTSPSYLSNLARTLDMVLSSEVDKKAVQLQFTVCVYFYKLYHLPDSSSITSPCFISSQSNSIMNSSQSQEVPLFLSSTSFELSLLEVQLLSLHLLKLRSLATTHNQHSKSIEQTDVPFSSLSYPSRGQLLPALPRIHL